MPQPKIDPNDTDLANAFEALADIGEEDSLPQEPPVITTNEPAAETMAPQPIPAPVVVEAPVAVAPPPQIPKPNAAVPATPSVDHASELADLARQPTQQAEETRARPTHKRHQSSLLSLPAIVAAGVTLIVGIGIGYGLGSTNRTSGSEEGNSGNTGITEKEPSNDEQSISVEGRITYRDESGQSKPDSGARVLVFPAERKGELKLSAVGFRSGDTADDFQIGKAALTQMGGATALTNDEGRYELSLTVAGEYQILVLSRFATQPANSPIDTDLQRTLAKYFLKPAELLGQVANTFGQLRYNGSEPTTWDHSFTIE